MEKAIFYCKYKSTIYEVLANMYFIEETIGTANAETLCELLNQMLYDRSYQKWMQNKSIRIDGILLSYGIDMYYHGLSLDEFEMECVETKDGIEYKISIPVYSLKKEV